MNLRRRITALAAATTLAGLATLGLTAPAQATAAGPVHVTAAHTTVTPMSSDGGPDNWFYQDAYSPCWTSFSPSSPRGAAMEHLYINCENRSVTVCPAMWVDGNLTVFYGWSVNLKPYGGADWGVQWSYPSTVWNANYTTVFC